MRAAILVVCLSALSAGAEPLATLDDVRSFADRVMKVVESGKVEQAFGMMKEHWPPPESEIDAALSQSLEQRAMVQRRFGKGIGVEFVCTESAGSSLAKFMYIEKFQKHAIRWQFFFYKPGEHWFVNTFLCDDNIHGMVGSGASVSTIPGQRPNRP